VIQESMAKKNNSEETPGTAAEAERDFERTMAELEEAVRRLEAGDLPLEQSLAAFERGIALVRTLHARLDAVQTRIDELTQAADGSTSPTPFAAPGRRGAGDKDDEVID
jgi:exodeoxyribonuclease VII small subunit